MALKEGDSAKIRVQSLSFYYGRRQVLRDMVAALQRLGLPRQPLPPLIDAPTETSVARHAAALRSSPPRARAAISSATNAAPLTPAWSRHAACFAWRAFASAMVATAASSRSSFPGRTQSPSPASSDACSAADLAVCARGSSAPARALPCRYG